ncbi:hypothetical protein L6452_11878 [Arctium lappa]|uniref:Uncharacterized protein n=1 Tax=Arctium lappa TaxID=4217 RepID=A0ACB9DPQ5_ARCLA|nr:hypothetical protein L6452_11878 [Arctium lappa]
MQLHLVCGSATVGIQCTLKSICLLRKTGEEMNFTYVECLLYTFHHLANKAPNATNNLCGYKIVTGQPSDRLGEDFTEFYKDFTERLAGERNVAINVGDVVYLTNIINSMEIVARGRVRSLDSDELVDGEEIGPNWYEVVHDEVSHS